MVQPVTGGAGVCLWSAHGFLFQRETWVQVGTCEDESRVGKRTVCLQPAGKQAQEWHSVGHPVVEMANDDTLTRTVLHREIEKDRNAIKELMKELI